MATGVLAGPIVRTHPLHLLRQAWARDKPLTLIGSAMVVLLVGTTFGLIADPRVITGAPAWLKPAKFAVSVAVYSFTLVWLLTYVTGRPRLVRLVSWATALALAVEMVLIVAAAATGTTSHFNVSTPTHATIWSVMAAAIVVVWLANLLVGLLLLRQRLLDRAFAWSLRLGVLVSAAGMGVAFLMTQPTAQQLQSARSGGDMTTVGAHSVGVADGGPGLPVVGWSTVGGDLRVAHFIGLHALQALPLLGLLIGRFGPRWLRVADRTGLIWVASAGYLGVVGLTTWQALRGQSLVNPDQLTLGALAVLVTAVLVSTAAILARARRRPEGPAAGGGPPVGPSAGYSEAGVTRPDS
ncbi:hypothetical protein C1I95_16910 [Micromonospora craterilacus]|uniref:Uncharacterized protein n=1 Tax=Micromonospora craterilacus TaxID=1655439 RepID=A0A2W2EW65_9ACTN|nr:hypothetical protein [Micromonospora craterilacus]PZG16708.1 hypothetical protein C1I95_16910 [Micromonospora craterilacus]